MQGMFREADIDNDGELTFTEWYSWLGRGRRSGDQNDDSSKDSGTDPFDILQGDNDKMSQQDFTISGGEEFSTIARSSDPMVAALGLVLGSAVCTLKVAARIAGTIASEPTNNISDKRGTVKSEESFSLDSVSSEDSQRATLLAASFIAGGKGGFSYLINSFREIFDLRYFVLNAIYEILQIE